MLCSSSLLWCVSIISVLSTLTCVSALSFYILACTCWDFDVRDPEVALVFSFGFGSFSDYVASVFYIFFFLTYADVKEQIKSNQRAQVHQDSRVF